MGIDEGQPGYFGRGIGLQRHLLAPENPLTLSIKRVRVAGTEVIVGRVSSSIDPEGVARVPAVVVRAEESETLIFASPQNYYEARWWITIRDAFGSLESTTVRTRAVVVVHYNPKTGQLVQALGHAVAPVRATAFAQVRFGRCHGLD